VSLVAGFLFTLLEPRKALANVCVSSIMGDRPIFECFDVYGEIEVA
jgi:hypothetical protein